MALVAHFAQTDSNQTRLSGTAGKESSFHTMQKLKTSQQSASTQAGGPNLNHTGKFLLLLFVAGH